jgi:hypothetical protein
MRQLTSLDAQFLAIEDGRNDAHVSSLAIYDPSTAPGGRLTIEAISELVRQRLHLLPPFRWRLAEVPLGIDYPYLAGARMEALFPVSAIMDGIGLNLTVMSYAGDLNFGVVADRDLVDDPWPLAEALQRAEAELLALVPARARRTARGPRAVGTG